MRGKTWFALTLVVLGWYYFMGQEYLEGLFAYPLTHKSLIMIESEKNKIDPALISAVILAESKFNENAVSPRGAVGLMQLMPKTAEWIAVEMNNENFKDEDLYDGSKNIRWGSWYLAYLLNEFKGNKVLALAAYNAGRGHVEEWMKEYNWSYEFNNIKEIPFLETRSYIEKVQDYEQHYKRLY